MLLLLRKHVCMYFTMYFLHRVTCQGCKQANWNSAAKIKVTCDKRECNDLKWYTEDTSDDAQWTVSLWNSFSGYYE